MRFAFALLLVSGTVATAETRQTSATPRVSACALLTKDLVTAHTPHEQQSLSLVLLIPPQEEPIGSGSSCDYGDIHLQVDPFGAPQKIEQSLAQKWSAVAGVGDVAYFRDNRGRSAELYVRSGSRVVTIQMGVPKGKTTEAVKPNAVSLAKALLAKLK